MPKKSKHYKFEQIPVGSLVVFFVDDPDELNKVMSDNAEILEARSIVAMVVPLGSKIALVTPDQMNILGIQILPKKESKHH